MTSITKRVESVNVVHARTQTRARFYISVQQSYERNLQSLLLCYRRVLVRQACYFIVIIIIVIVVVVVVVSAILIFVKF
jgi:t-SNARE complex subunit (syntaxin)